MRSWLVVPLLAAGLTSVSPLLGTAQARRTKGLCTTAAPDDNAPYLLVLSAFPGELAPIVADAEIEATVEADGKPYYRGRLGGVRVILGFTGIGMVNARNVTLSVLDDFEVAGILMSGVAGTQQRIGDVVLAEDWIEQDGKRLYRTNRALFALARRAVQAMPAPLAKCTPVRGREVCMAHDTGTYFGGRGVSGDGSGGIAIECGAGGGPVFGCELPAPMAASVGFTAVEPPETPDVVDMETAAVARVAVERKVPFLGVRSASDGDGDPLGQRGWVPQFFDYWPLAARNAGAVTTAIVTELGRIASDASSRRICRSLAARKWKRAAERIGAGS
jgi:adenosylhomocysteine nucleosidase